MDITVLILEDDLDIQRLLADAMRADGYELLLCASIKEFEAKKGDKKFDLYLLDVKLPDGNGMDLTKSIRAREDGGIIIITGLNDEIDTVLGLELGADDFIAKPFRLRELRARVKSVLRRKSAVDAVGPAVSHSKKSNDHFVFGGLEVKLESRTVRNSHGQSIPLTSLEFDLLRALIHAPNRVLSRDQLMNSVRGQDWHAYDRAIDGMISRVRGKLFPDGSGSEWIKTIRGVGYMLCTDK